MDDIKSKQEGALDTDFLQSEEWRKFQETVGRRTFRIDFGPARIATQSVAGGANIIEHKLSLVGSYFYMPHWPSAKIFNFQFFPPRRDPAKAVAIFNELLKLAKENNIGWIRFDPKSEEALNLVKENINYKVSKAPHDMQPREILVIDITKPEEQLSNEMKPKTRYNVKLAEKRGVKVISDQESVNNKYIEDFLRLVKLTAERKRIKFHPEDYYRKMIEMIPGEILKLYIAEYNSKVIAANLVAFYHNTAIYLHGATDDEYRNVMAPYLLQWQAIKDAKEMGCEFYDFGGARTVNSEQGTANNSWGGITKFKLGFSPNTKPVEFPGSYDIVLNNVRYYLYRIIQKLKSII
jgi:lipid II:glycine glycyltransferase (peptidoglycan interpeptide bridge formation enzyme)